MFCLLVLMFVTTLALPIVHTFNLAKVMDSDDFGLYEYTIPKNHKINVIFITEHGNNSWTLVTENGTTYGVIGDVAEDANMTIICDYHLAKKIMNSSHPIADIIDALKSGKIIKLNPGNEIERCFMKCLNLSVTT